MDINAPNVVLKLQKIPSLGGVGESNFMSYYSRECLKLLRGGSETPPLGRFAPSFFHIFHPM